MLLRSRLVAVIAGLLLVFAPASPVLLAEGKDANTGEKKGANGSGKAGKEKEAANESKPGKNGKAVEEPAEKPANDSFSVIQIGYEAKVVKSSEVGALREKVEKDFKAAVKNFEDAKKAAAKAKKKFTDTKPVKPVIKTIATALKSEADAKARRDKEAVKLEAQKKKAKEEAANRNG